MFARDLFVSCHARDVVTVMYANCHKPLDHHRSRLRPSLAAQRRMLGTRRLSRQPAWVARGQRRAFHAAGTGIHCGHVTHHGGAKKHAAKEVWDIAAQLTCRQQEVLELGGGRLRMAGKALESFPAARYPLSTYPWDPGAKSSAASEQTASWLSGCPCGVQHDRRLQGCSPELVAGTVPLCASLRTIVIHT